MSGVALMVHFDCRCLLTDRQCVETVEAERQAGSTSSSSPKSFVSDIALAHSYSSKRNRRSVSLNSAMASNIEPEIVLYDLACIKNVCFSPAVWRIRLLLNYKQVPYKTIFLEFPDIEPTLKGL